MNAESSPKTPRKRKRYDEEFKRSVVDHWRTSGKSAEQVAQEFGVSSWTLRDWKRAYELEAKPVDAPLPPSREALVREIQQLRKEVARLTLQRDILKKTMGILSEGPGPTTV
jgi:transposase